jgi:putative DNA methylase
VSQKRWIEETFPVKEVSEQSSREKNIRLGHISTLHIWWARRPLASSRATIYASLVGFRNGGKSPSERQLIGNLSKWESSLDLNVIEVARKNILESFNGVSPRILDPFGGGGSIPLEALRLGCDTYSNDYNPIAVLLQKCVLEYPQKYRTSSMKSKEDSLSGNTRNPLIEDVTKWSRWVLTKAKEELQVFYPEEEDGSVKVAHIWCRTIICENPSCQAEIPLIKQYWLVRKGQVNICLHPIMQGKEVKFKIVGSGYAERIPHDFNPERGTISKAISQCLMCGAVIDDKNLRKQFQQGKSGHRMIAIVTYRKGTPGKKYRIATREDENAYHKAEEYLKKKTQSLENELGMNPLPEEPIHTPDNKEYQPGGLLYNFTPVLLYNMTKWADLFNARQKLALITFVDSVRSAYRQMLHEGYQEEYAKAITTYLALAVDMTAAFNNTLARWENTSQIIKQLYGRQALSMLWDYAEGNPFSGSTGSFETGWGYYIKVIDHCARTSGKPAQVTSGSATNLRYKDNFFDAVFTDPPYYDNVPYSNLSDFFYVWLKRMIGDLWPDLFSTPLTPKSNEAIAELPLLRGMNKEKARELLTSIKTSQDFERLLRESFKEIHRVLKPNGIAVIVYAHKSTAGWETLLNSLLDSGLVVTAAWPINTEMKERLRAKESAALASSIYMVARKFTREPIGIYKNIKDELKVHLGKKLDVLWGEGISGADFFISAIGSSIEVFGRYESIIDSEERTIRAEKLLEDVRKAVTDYAVRQVLHNGFAAEISQLTRFYVLWRWAYGEATVVFDDALKLSQSIGIDLMREWNRGFVQKNKEFVRLLGPEERNSKELEGSKELIDVLHRVLLLWKRGKNEDVMKILKESGYGKTDVFYRVAQAISESLPIDSKEKRLIEGFLSGKERLTKNLGKETGQRRLFE